MVMHPPEEGLRCLVFVDHRCERYGYCGEVDDVEEVLYVAAVPPSYGVDELKGFGDGFVFPCPLNCHHTSSHWSTSSPQIGQSAYWQQRGAGA